MYRAFSLIIAVIFMTTSMAEAHEAMSRLDESRSISHHHHHRCWNHYHYDDCVSHDYCYWDGHHCHRRGGGGGGGWNDCSYIHNEWRCEDTHGCHWDHWHNSCHGH